jgi:hypothetical protein
MCRSLAPLTGRTQRFCAVLLDADLGLGGRASVTVGHSVRTGDVGAAAGGGGLGWSDGHEGREHRVPTQADPMSVSWRAG